MEIGQKSRCPVCDSKKTVEPQPQPPEFKIVPKALPSGFSKEELAKIDEFLKAHPTDWNDEFDEFYEQQVFAVNYKETYSLCSHRAELFAAIREMVKDAQKISAELMLRIMEEIPKKYPEIEENEARALAREFFKGRKQIRQMTLKNTAFIVLGPVALAMICKKEGINLSWKRRINDSVKVDEELCDLDTNTFISDTIELAKMHISPWSSLFGRNRHHMILKSPWSGRIVSIRTEPVQSMDDVICEIETLD